MESLQSEMPKQKVVTKNVLTSLDNISEVKLPKVIFKMDKNNNLSVTYVSSDEDYSSIIKESSSATL